MRWRENDSVTRRRSTVVGNALVCSGHAARTQRDWRGGGGSNGALMCVRLIVYHCAEAPRFFDRPRGR